MSNNAVLELMEAAKAVVARWHTPLWKDAPHTGEYIHRLAVAVAECIRHGVDSSRQGLRENTHNSVNTAAGLNGPPEPGWSEADIDEAAAHCGISDGHRDLLSHALRDMRVRNEAMRVASVGGRFAS